MLCIYWSKLDCNRIINSKFPSESFIEYRELYLYHWNDKPFLLRKCEWRITDYYCWYVL